MARSGLYKSEVKQARDTLRGQGKHASVDAVRIALGNTGSKTTIHKYLKELEEDDGGQSPKTTISDVLQDLVARLAAQLQQEADARIEIIRAENHERAQQQAKSIDDLRQENATLLTQLQQTHAAMATEQEAHGQACALLQQERTARHTADLQVMALKERLAENEQHRQSLEEKHQHARESLAHYRESVKEQRDQDVRRHEQQVQGLQAELRQLQQNLIVKQNELTTLNQEGVRLVSDLAHAQQSLYVQQARERDLAQQLETHQAVEQRNHMLEMQLADKDRQLGERNDRMTELTQQAKHAEAQLQHAHVQLAALQAKCDTQDALTSALKSYWEQAKQNGAEGA